MIVTASLLSPGIQVKVGQNKYEIIKVNEHYGLISVMYQTKKGVKTKAYKANDKVKIV